jgi:dipeptidyl aminopeptidase/acylaminoacyl peptidase
MLRTVAAWLIVLVAATPARAQQAGAEDGLTPEQVAMMQAVGEAEVSPDGRYVAFTRSEPRDPAAENGPAWSELYVYDRETGIEHPFIQGEVNVRSLAWTPDGQHISFLSRRDGDDHTTLYHIPINGGEAQAVFHFGSSVLGYDWSPDGEQVAFVARAPAEEDEALPYEPIIYEEELQQRKVWTVAVGEEPAEPQDLGLDGSVYALQWSPDGERLAVSLAPTPLVDDFYMRQRVRVVDAQTGAVTGEIANPGKLGMIAWSPDGTQIAMVSGIDIHDPLEGRLMVAPATGGTPTDVMPDFEGHVEQFAWTGTSTMHYLASEGVASVFGRVDSDGSDAERLLTMDAVALGSFSVSDDAQVIAFEGSTPQYPTEVHVMTAADEAPQRITNSNPWLEDVALGRQEVVRYEASDGAYEIEGMLIYPLDYQEGQRYPLVLVVHGGPEAHYDNGWLTRYSTPGQMAAARGFMVFYPNYRGSTGRGVEFATSSQADPAGKEFDDLVDGVDYLIDEGLVDAERVGVTGGSYGGYATGWLSTRYSDRFAAGVMFVGISNKISKVGTTDIPDEEFLVHARKRPWDDWQFFLERSPVYYAGQSETPLLILHGQDDPRVDVGQSHELYRHLKLRSDAPVRLVLYPGEGHGNRNSTARYDYSLRSLRWMEHYLKGEGGAAPSPTIAPMVEPVEMVGMQ